MLFGVIKGIPVAAYHIRLSRRSSYLESVGTAYLVGTATLIIVVVFCVGYDTYR